MDENKKDQITDPTKETDESRENLIVELEDEFKRVSNLLKLDPNNKELIEQRKTLFWRLGEFEPPKAFYVDATKDPRVNPNSLEFDLDEYHKAIDAIDLPVISEEVVRNLEQNTEDYSKYIRTVAEFFSNGGLDKTIDNIVKQISELSPEELEALQEETEDNAEKADPNKKPKKKARTGQTRANKGELYTAIAEKAVKDAINTYILQGTATNSLTKIRPNKENTKLDPVTGTAKITRGNFTVTIPHYEKLTGLKTSTYQLLDALTIKLTANANKMNNVVVLPLKEYMEMRGLKDEKEARKQINGDLETLFDTKLSFSEKRGNSVKSFLDMRICDAKGVIKNGDIYFSFGTTFLSLLRSYPLMTYQPELLQIRDRVNPNSYYLGRKLSELKNMNAGKNCEDLISVEKLLDVAPTIPKYEEVISGNKNLTDRIIYPLERDLDALSNILSWEYCHRNGEPLTQEEIDNFNYDVFVNCLVRIHWKDYPDQTERLARKQKKIEDAIAKKEKKEKEIAIAIAKQENNKKKEAGA